MGVRRRLRFLLPILGVVMGAMLMTAPSATAAEFYYQLGAANTANPPKCLVVRTMDNGARAVQYRCDSDFNDQFWAFVVPPGNPENEWFQIKKYNSGSPGKCLVVQGSANNAPAQQQTCAPQYYDQFWRVYALGDAGFMLQRYSPDGQGKCLVVRGNNNESPVVQAVCTPRYADQWWYQT